MHITYIYLFVISSYKIFNISILIQQLIGRDTETVVSIVTKVISAQGKTWILRYHYISQSLV